MRLKKGHFRLVHSTSREIGDGLFHGAVCVCVGVCVVFFFGKKTAPFSVNSLLLHALFFD